MDIFTELAPGSSSSSSTHNNNHSRYKYDVFISFRGADTRNTFTDHLYNSLLDAGFNTFLDDEEIETGEPLKPELESAIKSSRASVIVLSSNYASSTWCLDELVLILHQNTNFNQIVIPVFYHAEPTDIRKQQKSFGEAMDKHTQRIMAETNAEKRSQLALKMETWRRALTQIADLKGKDVKGRKETEFITEIVTDVHRRLGLLLSNSLPLLVGVDYEIASISSWLTDGSCHTADILTIVGIGGIGKTSLAKYVFQLHSRKFHKSSFVEGIDTRCNEQFNGLLDLQNQLHGDISKKNLLRVHDVSVYTSKIENALARKRVFIVLDDIGSVKQLDALLGKKGLHPGSKVIITTKDASLTKRCALFISQVHLNHREILLSGLSEIKTLELLCIHAFKSDKPREGYEDVSKELVKYCDGHPLALEVLGRSLHKRDVAEWEDCIKGLMKEPHPGIRKALRMSIDLLPSENDKELFKHIACFFVGKEKDLTETVLMACDINTRSGIRNLIDRCFLSIRQGNELAMHSLIQKMGKDLVRQESHDKPWERSRLWCHEESFKVLKQRKGTENLLGLALDMRMLHKKKFHGPLQLKADSLSNMDSLKLLQLNYVQLNGFFEDIPEELRWLCMHGFPFRSITLDLPMENLVALDMSCSNIESFDMSYSNLQPPAKKQKLVGSCSKYNRLLGSLKILDLGSCEQLRSLGGFFELPALERLVVRNCISLIEVCESLEHCVELVHINLSYCYNLKKLPRSMGQLKKVKTLLLDGCSSLKLQSSDIRINSQSSSSTIIEAIPSDSKFFTISLPHSLTNLSLSNINFSNESFPMDFSYLSILEKLCLDENPIVSMPHCVQSLPRLKELSMKHCKMLISIEHPPRTLRVLSVLASFKSNVTKIKFDPEMSSLRIDGLCNAGGIYKSSSFEIDGIIKFQAMADVEEKVIHSLGWTDLEFIKDVHYIGMDINGDPYESIKTQMRFEFGIFSIFYEGKDMPEWIRCRSKGSSISFTIPPSRKKLRGLNFCHMQAGTHGIFRFPMIKLSNTTRKQTWVYRNTHVIKLAGKCYLSFLSHWMFGPNEMQDLDQITISVALLANLPDDQHTMACGISLVYDEEDEKSKKQHDALGYYKSWNHIIGGDLSHFQLTTGEYILDYRQFMTFHEKTYLRYFPLIDHGADFKARNMWGFKAFSQKKSAGSPSHLFIKEVE